VRRERPYPVVTTRAAPSPDEGRKSPISVSIRRQAPLPPMASGRAARSDPDRMAYERAHRTNRSHACSVAGFVERWTGLDFLDVFRLWSLWTLLGLELDFVSLSQ